MEFYNKFMREYEAKTKIANKIWNRVLIFLLVLTGVSVILNWIIQLIG